jgi:hypothetical protein
VFEEECKSITELALAVLMFSLLALSFVLWNSSVCGAVTELALAVLLLMLFSAV